jgi:transposase
LSVEGDGKWVDPIWSEIFDWGPGFSACLRGAGNEDSVMPQVQLPLFADGTTAITPELAFARRDQQVVYFNGHLPVFSHPVEDLASFRFFTTQLIVNGTATQGQIVQAFGVPLTTVKRCCHQYRKGGASAFFKPPARRQRHRLTPERLAQAQALLDEGQSVPAISRQLHILASTLHKAIDDGRLKQIKKKRTRAAALG